MIPSANAYYVQNSSFSGMSPHSLRSSYDSGLTISSGGSTGIVSAKPEANGNSFCISAVANGHWAHDSGPGGAVVADPSTGTENPCS